MVSKNLPLTALESSFIGLAFTSSCLACWLYFQSVCLVFPTFHSGDAWFVNELHPWWHSFD